MHPIIVDLFIVIVLAAYAIDGYRRGLVLLLLELIGTFLTFYLAVLMANSVGSILIQYISMPSTLQRSVGFITAWIVLQTLYALLSYVIYPLIPKNIRESLTNHFTGAIPSVIKGVVIIAVVLTVLVVLPIQNKLKPAINESFLGAPMVRYVETLTQRFIEENGEELSEALAFLRNSQIITSPKTQGEDLKLPYTTTKVKPDPETETAMIALVNKERAKVGAKPLVADPALVPVARAHAADMFARGYFAHDTPEGKTPFDRIQEAGISYITAGENLALAPTLALAHNGLMNSPKHKENILYPDFGRIGIGVMDGGLYGKMFVQEFRD